MKHCVQYPDDKFLAVRPCLVAICFGNRPAAKLLGTLLYRYNLRIENKDDAENQNAIKAAKGEKPDQDTTYRIFRRQAQLVEDMCGEITEKTLHDVAVPMLQLLGYLDLEEHMQSNCYIVTIEQVQEALNLYIPTAKEQPQLEKFLIDHIQLEKFLIGANELEIFLIDKKNFLSGLEKVLIYNRNISNLKRGPKSKPEAVSKRVFSDPQNLKEESKKNKKKREDSGAIAPMPAPDISSQDITLQETVKTPAIKKTLSLPLTKSKDDTHFQLSTANVDKPASPSQPVEPLAETKWGTRKCLAWFDYWRGGILIGKFKLMQASTCAKGLAEQFDEETVIRIRGVMNEDPYYIARGGCDVCDVANNIHKYLNKLKKPVSATTGASKPRPTALVSEEQAKINRERRDARIAALAGGGR